jgi:hypothetical protein
MGWTQSNALEGSEFALITDIIRVKKQIKDIWRM